MSIAKKEHKDFMKKIADKDKKTNKGVIAGGAVSALGAKGTYDAHRIQKGFGRWGKDIAQAAESATGPQQIDAVYDAYIKGGKELSNKRFLGMRSGNAMHRIVDSVNKGYVPFLNKDVSLAGDAKHYAKFTGSSEKNLKNYMTSKGVKNNFEGKFVGRANVIKNNPHLSIAQKIKAMEDGGMKDAAREFSRATGKFGGEMLSIPGKYEKTLAPHLKKVKGVGAGVAALGAGIAGASAYRGRDKKASMTLSRAEIKDPRTDRKIKSSVVIDKPWYRGNNPHKFRTLTTEVFMEGNPKKVNRLLEIKNKMDKLPESSPELKKEYQTIAGDIAGKGPSGIVSYRRKTPLLFGRRKFKEMADNPRKFYTVVPEGQTQQFMQNAETGFSKKESPRKKWERYKPHTKKPLRIITESLEKKP